MRTIEHLSEATTPFRANSPGGERDTELLADCIGGAAAGARRKAAALLERFGSFSGALTASVEAIISTPGLTREDAVALHRAHGVARRLAAIEFASRTLMCSWPAVLSYVRLVLRHERREQFRVLFLDTRNHLIRDEVLGYGSVDHAPVYPREVVRRALELSASNLILIHNHPGGDPTPSASDQRVTKQIVEAGRALDIRVHDHLVVGSAEVASFRALGLLLES